MLPPEVIGVLGFLYICFSIGTLRAILAKRAVDRKAKIQGKPLVADRVAGTAK